MAKEYKWLGAANKLAMIHYLAAILNAATLWAANAIIIVNKILR